jgi:uncharacterized RDD family membrane protein YckC
MKCPKCGYLGFETVDRCRNCGYEFSLAPELNLPELPMRGEGGTSGRLDDLSLIDAAAPSQAASRDASELLRDVDKDLSAPAVRSTPSELPLFGDSDAADAPLITKPSPPRTPLSVRRSTPEVPKVRQADVRAPAFDLSFPAGQAVPSDVPGSRILSEGPCVDATASVAARLTAVAIDLSILAAIDAIVVYFTMQICGLTAAEIGIIPKGPLVAFLIVQNVGYLVAFTVGGQTLGKMAAGIKVVPARGESSVDLGHSIVRTLVWGLLAVPAGLGFLTALFTADRRGLHDRLAGTRVVRASA